MGSGPLLFFVEVRSHSLVQVKIFLATIKIFIQQLIFFFLLEMVKAILEPLPEEKKYAGRSNIGNPVVIRARNEVTERNRIRKIYKYFI